MLWPQAGSMYMDVCGLKMSNTMDSKSTVKEGCRGVPSHLDLPTFSCGREIMGICFSV